MKFLVLDLSTKTGYVVMEGEPGEAAVPTILDRGVIRANVSLKEQLGITGYPWAYMLVATSIVKQTIELAQREQVDAIVVEETNLGRNRYSQKTLEFIHAQFAALWWELYEMGPPAGGIAALPRVAYISTSTWRSKLGLQMSKEDRKNNAKLSKAKKHAALYGEKLDKAALGVKGKVNIKHLALRFVNSMFNLNLLMKQNDEADAICLGVAFLRGAKTCDGIIE